MQFTRSFLLISLLVVWTGTIRPSLADPPDDSGADEPVVSWAVASNLWQTAEIPQTRALREAVEESMTDEVAKKRIADALLRYETELRRMIGEARTDPSKAGDVLARMKAFQRKEYPARRALFTDEQYNAVTPRHAVIDRELWMLSMAPRVFARDLEDEFKLTAEQRARIGPAIDRLDDRINAMKAEMGRPIDPGEPEERAGVTKRMLAHLEEIHALSLEARSRVRAALTPEQLKRLDAGVLHPGRRADGPSTRPATGPTTRPTTRPGG